MELKWQRTACQDKWKCSNRTFMELKLASNTMKQAITISSNRTFMELKLPDALPVADS